MMPTHGEPHITREQLRTLHVSRDLYHWFLQRFPTGGNYQAIHEALIGDGRSAWLESLVDYAYAHNFGARPFLEQEIGSARTLAAQLTRCQAEQLHITPLGHASGRFTPMLSCTLQFASGAHALNIGCSGFQSNLAATGNGNFIGQSGDNDSIASAGYGCQLVSSGFAAKIAIRGRTAASARWAIARALPTAEITSRYRSAVPTACFALVAACNSSRWASVAVQHSATMTANSCVLSPPMKEKTALLLVSSTV
ncbi:MULTISPECIES: hypothetical protein [Symbiopectobacterium]|uniref:hypothetical protein n=1 Tax=Symbiopectobacterium TaxID=801 RepID=UPI001A2FD31C|nr:MULTISPECIES: hypothetical protein [Symbiopectobacterium]MBG6249178.1 hypothetical protein [Candidatus Symbiopectobacterium sp. PLON1]MBT9430490.1 hypothetical protein [Candidatus Symbiopectobacterium endolongispinus]